MNADGAPGVAADVNVGIKAPFVLPPALIMAGIGAVMTRAAIVLIVGFNRWIYRVIAYVALMTDQYPPFHLDQGGTEPVPAPRPTQPPSPVGIDLRPASAPDITNRSGQGAQLLMTIDTVHTDPSTDGSPRLDPDDDGIAILPDPPRNLYGRAADTMRPLWCDWRIGVGAAVGTTVAWGVVAGWWTPRSPLATSQAIWSIVISLVVSGVAGLATRSRWAMLAPIFASVP